MAIRFTGAQSYTAATRADVRWQGVALWCVVLVSGVALAIGMWADWRGWWGL